MTMHDLPILITERERDNKYIATGLAAQAFRAAAYDFTPDGDAVSLAIERGLLRVSDIGAVIHSLEKTRAPERGVY